MHKTMARFIDEHREELKESINKHLNFVPRQAGCDCPQRGTDHYHHDDHPLDDDDLHEWIINDEGLYNWARSEGVNEDEDEEEEDDE